MNALAEGGRNIGKRPYAAPTPGPAATFRHRPQRLTPDVITVLGLAAVITPFLAFHPGGAAPEPLPQPGPHFAAVAELREARPEDQPEPGELDIPGDYAARTHTRAASSEDPNEPTTPSIARTASTIARAASTQ